MKARCQCGYLSAEVADGAYRLTVACHCRDCQRRSGSPFGAIAYFPEASVILTGQATEFERLTDAGNRFTSGFCPRCGSTVYARASKTPQMIGITVGAFADPDFAPPALSVYEQSRLAWVGLPNDVPRHPLGSDS
jgi:hypothetical protein